MNKDLASGVMFMVLGGLFVLGALEYRLGSPSRLGPGYLPAGLGGILVVLGAAIAAKAFSTGHDRVVALRLKPILILTSAILTFALALRPLGFVLTSLLTVFIATFAGEPVSLVRRLIPAVILAAFCTAGFVYLLGLPLQIWPRFIG